jgi:hypothetical protein
MLNEHKPFYIQDRWWHVQCPSKKLKLVPTRVNDESKKIKSEHIKYILKAGRFYVKNGK